MQQKRFALGNYNNPRKGEKITATNRLISATGSAHETHPAHGTAAPNREHLPGTSKPLPSKYARTPHAGTAEMIHFNRSEPGEARLGIYYSISAAISNPAKGWELWPKNMPTAALKLYHNARLRGQQRVMINNAMAQPG